jgi:hypothetical protein
MIRNTIAYQYRFKVVRKDEGLDWITPIENLNKLLLGFDWMSAFNKFNKRKRFYWGFSVSGHGGDEMFPIIDAKIELVKSSLKNPEFMLEMAVMPGKLDSDQRKLLEEGLELCLGEDDFKLWWDDDPRGPRKRKIKIKKHMLEEVRKIKPYDGSDDLQLEDAEMSVDEAKEFFNLRDCKKYEIRKIFKEKLKEAQLRCHPDAETGSEEAFLFMQKCRTVLEKWLRY